MKSATLPICLICLLCGLNAFAAEKKTAIKPIRMDLAVKAPGIPVLTTNNMISNMQKARHDAAMASIRNMRAVSPPKPKPVSAGQLKTLTKKPSRPGTSTKLKASSKPVLTNLKLSSRKNYHGLGSLAMNEVRHVYGKDDYALFYTATDPSMAYVQARIKVEKGVRYLVDWTVNAPQNTEFTVGAEGTQKFSVGKGEHHLLIYLDSNTNNWTTLSLHSNTADYGFHSVEITKVQ